MRIAQITTSYSGGAGIAAMRMAECLKSVGQKTTVVSQRNSRLRTSLSSKVITFAQAKFLQSGSDLMTTLSVSTLDLLDLNKFEVLHFHSIYNLTNVRKLLQYVDQRKIFITLHDQRLLTGGCHYAGTCTNFLSNCAECPKSRQKFQKMVAREKFRINELINHPNVVLISPSNWLANLVSEITNGKKKAFVIRNPIPQLETGAGRSYKENSQLGDQIPNRKKVIGFIAENLQNPYKGLRDFKEALKLLSTNERSRIKILILGNGKNILELDHLEVIKKNFKNSTERESLILGMDLVVVPSAQDNYPNVIGESLMCGTPVLTSKVGGLGEITIPFALHSIDTKSPESFKEAIIESLSKVHDRHSIMNEAEKRFGFKEIGHQIFELYRGELKLNYEENSGKL